MPWCEFDPAQMVGPFDPPEAMEFDHPARLAGLDKRISLRPEECAETCSANDRSTHQCSVISAESLCPRWSLWQISLARNCMWLQRPPRRSEWANSLRSSRPTRRESCLVNVGDAGAISSESPIRAGVSWAACWVSWLPRHWRSSAVSGIRLRVPGGEQCRPSLCLQCHAEPCCWRRLFPISWQFRK